MNLIDKIKAATTKPVTTKAAPTWQTDPQVIAAQDAVARAEKALTAAEQAASEPAATVAKIETLILDAQARAQAAIAADDSAAFDAAVADQRRAEDRLKFDAARAAKFSHALALAQADVDRLKSEQATIEQATKARIYADAMAAASDRIASEIVQLAQHAWATDHCQLDRRRIAAQLIVGDGGELRIGVDFAQRLKDVAGDVPDHAAHFVQIAMSPPEIRGSTVMHAEVRTALERRGYNCDAPPAKPAPIAAHAPSWLYGLVKV
jgi:hypothetical protein